MAKNSPSISSILFSCARDLSRRAPSPAPSRRSRPPSPSSSGRPRPRGCFARPSSPRRRSGGGGARRPAPPSAPGTRRRRSGSGGGAASRRSACGGSLGPAWEANSTAAAIIGRMERLPVGVVVVNWNGGDAPRFLPRRARRAGGRRGSSSSTTARQPDEVRRLAARDGVFVLPLGANRGFAPASNAGAVDARLKALPYVAFVNNDAVLEPGYLAACVGGARGRPGPLGRPGSRPRRRGKARRRARASAGTGGARRSSSGTATSPPAAGAPSVPGRRRLRHCAGLPARRLRERLGLRRLVLRLVRGRRPVPPPPPRGRALRLRPRGAGAPRGVGHRAGALPRSSGDSSS